ncbi:twin-arginine translocation signal domain-containing protein [Bradyrhizobium sp. CCGUVB23]|uniref:twin-arginine translocation signal domain-containing protein n=1 Tax=Bradyrhizobium sp. CCGUVB23 TaxID=2949630 RepID=UPI0020B200A2|nr:twin-arginine translocation signal domain-containing protein [Bradyrhizobium sp. CCGUVB23]MCP3461217.1 twin-arginine translocation signal domain-containing protein [Bradyrhizobium sp. CCGUVB23]
MHRSFGSPPVNRRDVLRGLAAAAALGAAPASGGEARRIGLQLYTVRDLLKSDFEGTLRKVARLGYREVEFAGILGPDVKRTSELLRSLGLAAPSLHLDCAGLRDKTGSSSISPMRSEAGSSSVRGWTHQCDRRSTTGSGSATN